MRANSGKLTKIPDTPGVYFFKKGKQILYAGKATSLRSRVRSYFSGDISQSRGPRIVKMLEEATDVSFEETDSVLEALIREAQLIKKYQPLYNSKEKSDKSYNHVVITNEPYPRVFTVRGRDLVEKYEASDFRYTFGPFPHGNELKEALRIIRKIFPFRGEKDPIVNKQRRASYLRREIGLVPDFEQIGKQEYRRTIQHIRLFFEGKKKKKLISELEKKMQTLAQEQKFEEAEHIKRQIFALQHIRDVSMIKEENAQTDSLRFEAYDVAHTAGTETVGVMVVLEDGRPQKSRYRKFKLTGTGGDTGGLKEMLTRRLHHDEWPLPRVIVVDGGKAQQNAAQHVLEGFGYAIPVVAVTKNERHQPKKILGPQEYVSQYERDIVIANSEAHRFALSFHRQRRKKSVQ